MKKCLIIVNIYKKESMALGAEIATYLETRGIESDVYEFGGEAVDKDDKRGASNQHEKQNKRQNKIAANGNGGGENPFAGNDFVVTLGGDGTVLFAARGCARLDIPVFPVNLGEFGFIASIEKAEWQSALDNFLAGDLRIDERNMIQAHLVRGSGVLFSLCALNDIVISAATAACAISFRVSYNAVPLGTFKADGVIISTATGSTAYSASAGGPIVDPELDAIVLTPINAFSLSSRPLVLHPSGKIDIEVLPSRDKGSILTVDGQPPFSLCVGDVVTITKTPYKVKLAGCSPEKFYGALRSKLNWAGGPHA